MTRTFTHILSTRTRTLAASARTLSMVLVTSCVVGLAVTGCATSSQPDSDEWVAPYPVASEQDAAVSGVTPQKVAITQTVAPYAYTGMSLMFDPGDAGKTVSPRIVVAAVGHDKRFSITAQDINVTSSLGSATVGPEEPTTFNGPWTWTQASSPAVYLLPNATVPDDGVIYLKVRFNTPAYFVNGALVSADTGTAATRSQWSWSRIGQYGLPTSVSDGWWSEANEALPGASQEKTAPAAPAASGWGDSASTWVPDPQAVTVANVNETDTKSLNATLTQLGIDKVRAAQRYPRANAVAGLDASKCVTPSGGTCVLTVQVSAPDGVDTTFTSLGLSFVSYVAGVSKDNAAGWSGRASVDGQDVPVAFAGTGPIMATTTAPLTVPGGQKKTVTWTVHVPAAKYDELGVTLDQTVHESRSVTTLRVDARTGVITDQGGVPGLTTDLILYNWLASIGQTDKWDWLVDGRDSPAS